MQQALGPADFARAVFFALLPAVAAGGAMGLPVLLSLAGIAALSPGLFRQVIEKKPLVLAFLGAWTAWAALSSLWSPWDGPTAAKTIALIALGLPFIAAALLPDRDGFVAETLEFVRAYAVVVQDDYQRFLDALTAVGPSLGYTPHQP